MLVIHYKLGCASVKLLVWLNFTKALSDFITKKDMKFFFQFEKGKYEPIFGIIIVFKVTMLISIVSNAIKVLVVIVVIVVVFV